MDKTKLTRKELYDLVWAEPMTALSKKYSISDNGLRKICKKMNIPIPKTGHWQKIRYGKRLSITALPSEFSGKDEINLSIREAGDVSNIDSDSPVTVLQKAIEIEHKLLLIVPEKLSSPDKLIVQAKDILTSKKPNDYRYKGMVYCSRELLDISVTVANVGRALRFMDTFIKLLRVRGHNIIVKYNKTYAVLQGEEVEISFKERTKRVVVTDSRNWQSSEYHPTGILVFKMKVFYRETEWKDGKLPIENQLSKILAKMEIKANEHKLEQLEWKKERERQEEQERIKQARIARKEKELSDFKGLLKEAHRWREVTILRTYVIDVEARAKSNNSLSEELKEWLTWANKKLDWYDPNIKAEDSLLKGVDRDSLTFK